MELRPDASHKENVPPRPPTPLKPEQRRLLKSPGVVLSSGHGRWVPTGQAERGEPATTPSPEVVFLQEPCRVQTNLASPIPHLGLALKDTTGRLINRRVQQQSNIQPLGVLPQGAARTFAIRQSNLGIREASLAECGSRSSRCLWSEPQESFWPHRMPQGSPLPGGPQARPSSTLKQSLPLATDTLCLGFRPTARYAHVHGHTQPGSRSWSGLENWTSRLLGESLTLEDLAVPVKSQAGAPSQASISQLLASVQHLEHEAARLRCRETQEPPGPSQQEPWTSDGQALPACPQPSQPGLASWDKRKKHPRGLRGAVDFPETPGLQVGLSDCQASSKPASPPPETTLEVLTGEFLDPEQGGLPACALGQRERPAYSRRQRGDPLLPRGVGSREARLCPSTFSRAVQGLLPRQEGGEKAPREPASREEESTASSLPAAAPARRALQNKARNIVTLESQTACWQLLSRCFRAWQHLVQRRRAVVAAVALGHRQLLRRGLQAFRWALWLREAQLEVVWRRHTRALLARSFQKWRNLTQQQKQGQPHIQAGPGPVPSGGGQGQGPSGRKPVVDPAQRSSPGRLREKAGPRPIPLHSGPRPDGGDRRVQILQALQRLAAFLLWCYQKEWARQEKGVQREASGATLTQSMGRPPQACCSPAADTAWVAPLAPQPQRACLRRCFGAWQQLVRRGALYQEHRADCQMGALRMCLRQWMWMKQLRAAGGAKVPQLSLCRQKEGMWSLLPGSSCRNMALCSSAPGGATSHGLGWVAHAQGLPQERGPRLALHQVLLLWRARLSQRQRADSFFQGMQHRMLRRILRAWHLRVWDQGTPSDSTRTTLALESLCSIPGGEVSLGCNTPRSSLEKASRAPALLDTLRRSFLWAAGRRQQARCLLLWQARAQRSQSAARWHQHTLRRRILLSWSHWAVAQGAQRELAALWACNRSRRAALGLWRWRLEQRWEAEQWAREQGRRQVRDALQRWPSCWQRQQFLREQCQRWRQVHRQGLQRAVFRSWQQAAHRRRRVARPEQLLLRSHSQAWCGSARDAGMLRARCRAFQDGLRRRALGAAFAMWRKARVAAAQAYERHVARASIARWRSHVQGAQADRQLRRVQARQAFVAWRVALGQRCEAHQQAEERARTQAQVALCWTLWVHESRLHRLSRAHAARKLSARVLEAWAQSAAQGRVQRVAITQFQQIGHRHLLRTHWAQWRTALLRVWLEPWAEAPETSTAHPRPSANLRQRPRLASRGCLLVLMDTVAPWKQTRSCRPQGTGPMPPSPTQHHSLGGQRKWRETSWAQSNSAVQLWMQWPGLACWAQDWPPPGPGEDCSSETSAPKGKGQVDRRWLGRKYLRCWHLEALLRRLQGSQQARRLAATWQRWVDAQGAEELARSLLRQWHLRWAWRTWWQRAVRLQVARRLQQQDEGWVLSQAFEKWHQNLAARSLRRSHQRPETPE